MPVILLLSPQIHFRRDEGGQDMHHSAHTTDKDQAVSPLPAQAPLFLYHKE